MTRPLPWVFAALAAGALIAAAGVLTVVKARADDRTRVDAAIVLMADVSSSMGEEEWSFVRSAHAYALMSGEFLEGVAEGQHKRVAVTYVEFSSGAAVIADWTLIDSAAASGTFVERVQAMARSSEGTTNIAAALNMAADQLMRLPWPADKLVVDLVGDGLSDRDAPPAPARDRVVALGATINGMPLLIAPDTSGDYLQSYYRQNIVGGPTGFLYPVDDISQLPVALRRKLVLELF